MDSSAHSRLLESVLARALELRDEGRADWLESACKDCPELLDSVREAAGRTGWLPQYYLDPSATDSAVGRTIAGRFRLSRRIGSGAMGVVYLAEDLELVRSIAVKVLRYGLMDPEQSASRFLREAEAMAAVQHPSVVTIHDRGRTQEGEPFIVMEWIDGTSLGDIVAEARRRSDATQVDDTGWIQRACGVDPRGESSYLRTAVRWIAELAAGLEVVHAAGVLHRDIKPSNVIVRKDGRAVLLDFGIALLDGDSTLTRGATSVGTPAYMPPESLVRGRHRSPAGDVYSLTATLYHLLALRPPYEGTPSEVLSAIATREPVPAVRHRPGLPRDLQAILEKGMHRKPHARYASAGALEADLRAFLEHRPVVARPVTALARATRALLRSKFALGAGGALGLVLLAGVALGLHEFTVARQQARTFEFERHFPPGFTIVGRTNRVYRYAADSEHLRALLDEAAAAGGDPLRVHLLRASFRLDHGDPAGAVRDMSVVAGEAGTAYARELASRYAAPAVAERGSSALDVDGLPARTAAVDRYLEAYHLMRSGGDRNEVAAHELLSDPAVREIPHAEELRLASTPFGGLDSEAQFERAFEAYLDTLRLEARIGGRTAATAHVAGRMLDVMNRYGEALDVLREGVLLADRAHTLRINAGFAAYALGLLDEARSHLEVAIDLRPNYEKPLQNLVWVLIEQGEFDEALLRIAHAPLDEGPATDQTRLLLASGVELQRALAQKECGELEASKLSVQRASANMLAAKAEGPIPNRFRPNLVILEGLEAGNEESVVIGLVSLLLDDPHHAWQLQTLLRIMPAKLGPDGSAAVRTLLATLAQRLTSRHLPPASPAQAGVATQSSR